MRSPSHTPPSGRRRTAAALAGAVALVALGGGVAAAQAEGGLVAAQAAGGGGAVAPGEPVISDVVCVTKCIKTRIGIVGARIRITGTDLGEITVVSMPRSDGKRAKDIDPLIKPSGAVLAYVKKGAITGRVRVGEADGTIEESPADFRLGTKAQLEKAQAGWRFPIRGPHYYGDGIGADRGDHKHQGQDVMAKCGTRLVAARGGKVQYSGYQAGGAGNYVVIDGAKSKHDFVYMHLLNPSPVKKGYTVATGQKIGKVGSTGSSSACHLHFEMWGPPGWYEGGHFVNPTPFLKYWDSFS